jgi:hypothetical protein
MSLCEGFCRQPIALIGHDGLELGRGRSDPTPLPHNYSGERWIIHELRLPQMQDMEGKAAVYYRETRQSTADGMR